MPLRLRERVAYQVLSSISRILATEERLPVVVEEVLRKLDRTLDLLGMSLASVQGRTIQYRALAVEGVERLGGESDFARLARYLQMPLSECERLMTSLIEPGSAASQVARTRRSYLSGDLMTERSFPEDQSLLDWGVRYYLRAPLLFNNQVVGLAAFSRRSPRPFESMEVRVLEDTCVQLSTVLAYRLALEEARALKNGNHAGAQPRLTDGSGGFSELVGNSAALHRTLETARKVADSDSAVLITGETGTGKELIARAIHATSPRAGGPLVVVNCGGLPTDLVFTELFGYERGAFTGAMARHLGRFEAAASGTIFLDEIGELPLAAQASLLRVLQEGEFQRVGGGQTLKSDARVIAATNRDLNAAVREGTFRGDLLYRLNVIPIHVPSLRERQEDIATLANHFASEFAARSGRVFHGFSAGFMERLCNYHWPGNVRELKNVVERAFVLADVGQPMIDTHPKALGVSEPTWPIATAPPESPPAALAERLKQQEREAIEDALRRTGGRVAGPSGAARLLGMAVTTMESKIRRLGIMKANFLLKS